MFVQLCRRVGDKLGLGEDALNPSLDIGEREPRATALIPGSRVRYLAEIAEQGRAINRRNASQAELASTLQHLHEALSLLEDAAAATEAAARTSRAT